MPLDWSPKSSCHPGRCSSADARSISSNCRAAHSKDIRFRDALFCLQKSARHANLNELRLSFLLRNTNFLFRHIPCITKAQSTSSSLTIIWVSSNFAGRSSRAICRCIQLFCRATILPQAIRQLCMDKECELTCKKSMMPKNRVTGWGLTSRSAVPSALRG